MGKKIKISSAKSKGRELQKWTCEKIADSIGEEFGKDTDIESRPMGQSGTDVRLSPRTKKKFPFAVECKRAESWSIHEWIKQAKTNQDSDTDWIVIARRSRDNAVAIIDADTFFKIWKELTTCRKKLKKLLKSSKST